MSRKRIENNISYDERNRLYYVTFHYGMDASGKRVKKTKTYDTHIAAAQALRIFEMKKQRQEIVMPTELTVGMWLDRWLEEVIRPNRARSTTYGYSNMIKNHIKPALGKIILQELTPQQIQAYYLAMREAGLNTNTVHKHHQLLFTALDFAVRQEVARTAILSAGWRHRPSSSPSTAFTIPNSCGFCSGLSGVSLWSWR